MSKPVVANQALSFGRLTLSGAGAVPLVATGGAITSITLGTRTTGSNHFTTSGANLVPSAVPSDAQYVWTGCVATGAGGDSATFTLTINTVANKYSCRSVAELSAVLALGVATVSGKTVTLRDGSGYTGWAAALSSVAFTSQFTLEAENNKAAVLPVATDNLTAPTHLRLYRVKVYGAFILGTHDSNNPALKLKGIVNDFTIEECEFAGNLTDLIAQNGYYNVEPSIYGWSGILGKDGTVDVQGPMVIKNNVFHDSIQLLVLPAVSSGSISVYGNELYNSGVDFIFAGSQANNALIAWNKLHSPLNTASDPNHCDFIQITDGGTTTSGLQIVGNQMAAVRQDGVAAKTHIHGFLQQLAMDAGLVAGNLIYTGDSNGIKPSAPTNSEFASNTLVVDSAIADSGTSWPVIAIDSGSASGNEFADNVARSTGSTGGTDYVGNNQVIDPSAPSGASAYSTLFDGPAFTGLLTNAAILSAFSAKAGRALVTAIPKIGAVGTGYVDFAGQKADIPRVNRVGAFTVTDKTGQTVSSLITSTATQITSVKMLLDGIGTTTDSVNGALVRVSGGVSPEFRITSDAGGSSIVTDWTSTPAIIQAGQYLWLRDTSSGSGSTQTNIVAKVGNASDTWSITTAGSATAPAQFGTSDWSISDANTVDGTTISITTLPSDGGSAITDLQYQVDGGSWVSLGGTTTGIYGVSAHGLTFNTASNVAIRAVNAIGNGTASATKSVTPTGSAEVDAYNGWIVAAGGTQMATARAKLYQTLYASLKSGAVSGSNILAKLDQLYVMAAADAATAKLNLIANSANLTTGGSPTFTADRGYAGDGTSAYLDWNVAMSGGVNYTRNSASLFAYEITNVASATFAVGCADANQRARIVGRDSGNNFTARINDGTNIAVASQTTSVGLSAANRSGASSREVYKNGSAIGSDAQASSNPTAGNVVFLRENGTYAARSVAAGGRGASMSANEHLDLYNALHTFMVAVGADT